MSVSLDFSERTAIVTGACGALGSATVDRFREAGATVAGVDIIPPEDDDALVTPEAVPHFYQADLTDETAVADTVEAIVADHGSIDHLLNIAGTWRGGDPIEETDLETYQFLIDVNLTSAFLTSKHALPHLQAAEGTIVSVSARASLSGGEGDGPYRISKAGIRLLTETIAAENRGTVRANAVMPSVIDTPMNREMMEPSDEWVDPADVAMTMAVLSSAGTPVTSGAAVPVYGEA